MKSHAAQHSPPYRCHCCSWSWWVGGACTFASGPQPEALAALRTRREGTGRPLHDVTVYDNGVPVIESPWERERTQAPDVWASNGTLDGTLSWYSVNAYARDRLQVADPWRQPRATRGARRSTHWKHPRGAEKWPRTERIAIACHVGLSGLSFLGQDSQGRCALRLYVLHKPNTQTAPLFLNTTPRG